MVENWIQDLAYAGRTLRRGPAFTLTAAVTIALGIGASTAIFSVTNAVLLRPLPYRNPDRLVLAHRDFKKRNARLFLFSNADFFDLRNATKGVFEDVAGVVLFRAFVPREDGSVEQLSKALVTTNFFRLLGAKIAFGRDFTEADGQPQPAEAGVLIPPGSAAILSYEYWQRRYGGNGGVLGREMLSSGQRGPRIVGVLAPGFKLYFPPGASPDAPPDFWVANNLGYDSAHRNLMTLQAIGRLKDGVTLERAREQSASFAAEQRKNFSSYASEEMSIGLEPVHAHLVAGVRPAILALMGAVIFLLLIGCANVANLLLVRASLRERELAVRTALGAPGWRLMEQILAEALLLAGLGTLLGLGLARLGIQELLRIAPANLPRLDSAAIDWRVLVFAATSGLAAAALFGLLPAWRAARPEVMRILRGRTAGAGAGRTLRNGVVIGEVALSFVLLIGSGLMLRSFVALQRIDPGYDPHGVLTFVVTREWSLPRQQGRQALLREMQERLRALPGVENVSAALTLPLTGGSLGAARGAGAAQPARGSAEGADFAAVLPGYFETLRTPLLAGRTFTEDDNAPGRRVAVIDQILAAKAFPNESAVGKRILAPGFANPPWVQVIGIVAPQRAASLADPGRGTIYFADGLNGIGVSRYWALRTAGDPANYAAAVHAEIRKIDRQLVISKMQPMEALVDRDQAGTRFALLLIGIFAAIAVLLASVGLYGVLSTVVRQRTAEIGVRMALGAAPASIFQLVVGQGLRLTAAGIAIGLLAALGLTRVMAGMLVGVAATDPYTFAAMAVLFFLIVTLACWLPARRAAGIDPTAALREE